MVLDPTPSSRLQELEQAFVACGGRTYIGENAWQQMEAEAGEIMSTFIEKYIRPPLDSMTSQENNHLLDIQLSWSDQTILIEAGIRKYQIPRANAV